MSSPSVSPIMAAFAKERAVDTALSSLGVSAALVSASFAAYMVVVGPHAGARGDRPSVSALPVPQHSPLLTGSAVPPQADAPESIDFAPTGSVPTAEVAKPRNAAEATALLTDFAVRDVFDGTALVEAHGALQMVDEGGMLPGAGEVLSIARERGVWEVKTTGGTIRQRR